jgi:hypothetical protein
MGENSKRKAKSPWPTIIGIAVVIVLFFYCSEHPDSFFSHLFRVIVAP